MTQNERVLKYMNDHGSITQIEALRDLGVMRLASRISDLKKSGVDVISETEAIENRYGEKVNVARYRLRG